MNIGFFTDTYFPQVSGVSTSVKLLRDELVRQGHNVIIFTTTDPAAKPEIGVVRLPSIPFINYDDRRIAYSGFDRCLKIARQNELDIVHTHTEFSLGMAGKYVASRMKIPNVHTYHTMYENYTHYILQGHLIHASHVRYLSKLYCNQTQGIITPSKLTHDTLRNYGISEKIEIIPTGVKMPPYSDENRVQVREELGLAPSDIVLLSLSRVSKEKKIDEVIAAFPEIKEKVPNARLVIAGDGPILDDLKQISKERNLDIIFVGGVEHDQVDRYYQMADLYINASDSESQGLTYLEAFANRLPIIARRNPYLESIMPNENFGALFDDENTLVETALDFLQKKETQTLQVIDQKQLRKLSSEYFGECVAGFYQEVIDEHTSSLDLTKFDKMYMKVKDAIREMMVGGMLDD
ncbi:glycosyltransferase [Aerococcaceae bacterium DSM 109653]|uniref:Glycosyltransferase n=1 Tax=Fundicoccus ignavus TaxID=2664442 RepID=A0A6I2GBK2_9LACT|nr:glycosyltransferase [Fundicoccus ignavus]MRI81827.1 glycosyltransferase [Fundicoccus ignavus]MRI85147.1 glycosyltransferase [Fundicoccus ignavus]